MESRKYPLLERKGFKITLPDSCGYFPDDYIVILESPYFSLHYGLERFTAFIKIAAIEEKKDWISLALVKATIYNE